MTWTKLALADLRELVGYISKDDRATAERFGGRVVAKVGRLAEFPRIGRIVPEYREDRLREVILPPYRIVYEIDDERRSLAILRIWHGARGDFSLPL